MTKFQRLFKVELRCLFHYFYGNQNCSCNFYRYCRFWGSCRRGGGLGSTISRAILIQDMSTLAQATLTLMAMAIVFDFGMGYIEKKLQR